jgi:pseudouridine-5'-phosphate glycosidase
MEREVTNGGALPATVAVHDGRVCIGIKPEQMTWLAKTEGLRKISVRDFGPAIAQKASGGTTVAGTIYAAQLAGIKVMATGGIGGVHRFPPNDISTDLGQLARTPLVVVCAGAKAILDLPGTIEYLETLGVPVLGYQTDQFPAFYSRDSGLPVPIRVDTPAEVVACAQAHWEMGMPSALLVTVPPPEYMALPKEDVEGAITQAVQEAEERDIRGQASTPFLLERVSQLTGGASLKANLGLLLNNARVASQIAVAMASPTGHSI